MASQKERPLSPHATIYRPPAAMMTSIMHRFSAIAMYLVGAPLTVWWLWSLSEGPAAYGWFTSFARSWFGMFVLFGLSWCLFQHLASGLRHLMMDLGAGYDLKAARNGALATFAVSMLLTLGSWTIAAFK